MRELKEAGFWLQSANKLLNSKNPDREKYTVVVAQTIHSIIRANDAMTLKFLGKRAPRHDDAPLLFLKLIQLNKIPSKFSGLRSSIIVPAIQLKSKADYKGVEMSKSNAEKWVRKAEKFLNSAKESLEQ